MVFKIDTYRINDLMMTFKDKYKHVVGSDWIGSDGIGSDRIGSDRIGSEISSYITCKVLTSCPSILFLDLETFVTDIYFESTHVCWTIICPKRSFGCITTHFWPERPESAPYQDPWHSSHFANESGDSNPFGQQGRSIYESCKFASTFDCICIR